MKLVALLCAALLPFILVQAAPGNTFSAKKSRKPWQATGVIATLPPLPQNLLVPQTPQLDDYTALLGQQVRQIPQYPESNIQGTGWRLDLSSMLAVSSSVRKQMAEADPSKRQYLPLFTNGQDLGWNNPFKIYAMPLDPHYFKPTTAYGQLTGRGDLHKFAILGVWHNDPADAHEYFAHGPRVALYGFANALNTPRADTVLPDLDPAQGLSHDLYRVLSVHP